MVMLVYVFTPLGPLFWDNSISLATGILEKICARVVFMASCCMCFCLVSVFVFLWTLCFFFCSIILSCFNVLFLLCFSPILSTFTNLSPDVEFSITLFSVSMTFSEYVHTHFICIPAVHIISFSVSFLSPVDELNKLASLQCMGLHSSAGRALQR